MPTDDHSRHSMLIAASNPHHLPVLLTIPEVAAFLRCSVATVRRRIARGDMAADKVGGRVLVHRQVMVTHATRCRMITRQPEVAAGETPAEASSDD